MKNTVPKTPAGSSTRIARGLGLAVVWAALAGAPAAAQVAFEQYELVTGAAGRQTVLTGFLLDGAMAELAVVHVDAAGDRRLRIYEFGDGTWVPQFYTALRPGVQFVDVAEIGGGDRLLTYERGRLNWFDPAAAAERPLMEIATSYKATEGDGIPHVDITRDLNRDGRDDLVLPDVDGFWISTQSVDGSFTEAVKLGPPEPFAQHPVGGLDLDAGPTDGTRTYGDVGITAVTVPWYLSRVHSMDYDHDGRSDLVFWNRDHFDVYRQDEHGRFDPVPGSFTVEVPFDTDGAYSRMFEFADQGALSAIFGLGEKTRRTVLHSFRDLDGDGVADLVTLTLSGRGITRQRSRYEVHFGTATADGTVFAREAGATIQPRGKAGGMQPWGYSSQWFEDFDGDGQVDILFRDVKVGFGGMVRTLSARSIPINLQLYRGEDGVYPDRPSARRKIRPAFHTFGRSGVFFPAALIGDVNGDGRLDLLVGGSRRELHVFLGVPGPDLLAQQPLEVAVALPDDERNSRLVDLNRDGRKDLLVHHRSGSGPQRVTLLIAR